MKTPTNSEALPLTNCSALEIWVNNPNSCKGWVRHSGPFTSYTKTEKRVRDIKLFDAVKGCRFQIRSLPNVKVHTPLPARASDETEVKP